MVDVLSAFAADIRLASGKAGVMGHECEWALIRQEITGSDMSSDYQNV